MFSGQIGRYEYCTLEDFPYSWNERQCDRDYNFVMSLANKLKEYAYKLAEYEKRYIDDGK